MRELIGDERINQLESVVVANVGDVDGLCDAFRGCHAIFHPSSFVDPHGVSGYSVSSTLLMFQLSSIIIASSIIHLEVGLKNHQILNDLIFIPSAWQFLSQ